MKEYLTKVSANDLELVDKIVSSFENNESYTIGPLENGNSYERWTLDHYEGDGDLQEDGEEDP